MKIYIPTMGRPNKQITIQSFSDDLIERTTLCVISEEYNAYKKLGINLIKFPMYVHGISAKRQWLFDNIKEKFICFMDDDLQFSVRHDGIKLKNAESDDVDDLLSLWKSWLKSGIPLVGVSLRGGNNHVEEDYHDIGRIMSCYAFDREIFMKENIRFDRVPLMQDFDMTLQILKAGYIDRISYKYAHHQAGGSNAKGGCSTYRTPELIRDTAIKMSKLHPGIVTIQAKKSKTTWSGMEKKKGIDGTVRTDVNVHWKKAYHPRTRKENGITKFL
jgi:glycosyltransferase involved in cell wall biosynthesis